jgi:nucleoside-diphosphate kinase
MATERTLSIIKPDATRRNLTGRINAVLEEAGLRIVAQRRTRLTQAQAEAFYAVHRERPFFQGLVEFMTSGPVVVQVLEGENAVAKNREVMGATDPKKAASGTIRAQFAGYLTILRTTWHGSASFASSFRPHTAALTSCPLMRCRSSRNSRVPMPRSRGVFGMATRIGRLRSSRRRSPPPSMPVRT